MCFHCCERVRWRVCRCSGSLVAVCSGSRGRRRDAEGEGAVTASRFVADAVETVTPPSGGERDVTIGAGVAVGSSAAAEDEDTGAASGSVAEAAVVPPVCGARG